MSSDDRILPLDGLRAIAILLVLAFHFAPRQAPFGWLGVDLFFVLSGFLITGILVRTRDQPHRFRVFYARRALRIFPLYYATLIAAFVVLPLVCVICQRPASSEQAPYWLYYSNIVGHSFHLPVNLGHFWSLAVEEHYYAIWPFVIFAAGPQRARTICLALIATAIAWRFAFALAGAAPETTFGWTPARVDGLALGSLLALMDAHLPKLKRASFVAGAIAAASLAALAATGRRIETTDTSTTTIAFRTLEPAFGALLFGASLVLALEWTPAARILSIAPLRFLAKYSYAMYVFHMFLLPEMSHHLPHRFFFVSASAITIVLAVISYHAYEKWFLMLKPRYE